MRNFDFPLVLLHLYDDPGLITLFLNEPEIGNLLIELSRIYHDERYQTERLNSNSNHVIEMLTENPWWFFFYQIFKHEISLHLCKT